MKNAAFWANMACIEHLNPKEPAGPGPFISHSAAEKDWLGISHGPGV